jgi:hypothetical protein
VRSGQYASVRPCRLRGHIREGLAAPLIYRGTSGSSSMWKMKRPSAVSAAPRILNPLVHYADSGVARRRSKSRRSFTTTCTSTAATEDCRLDCICRTWSRHSMPPRHRSWRNIEFCRAPPPSPLNLRTGAQGPKPVIGGRRHARLLLKADRL